MVELPVIKEGVSTPRGPTRRKSSGSRRAPAAGGSKRRSTGTEERENPCIVAGSDALFGRMPTRAMLSSTSILFFFFALRKIDGSSCSTLASGTNATSGGNRVVGHCC